MEQNCGVVPACPRELWGCASKSKRTVELCQHVQENCGVVPASPRELWVCANKSNTFIMQRSQSEILRATANAPRYVTNHTLLTKFNNTYVSDVIHERINEHHNKPEAHPNPQQYKHQQTKTTLAFRLTSHRSWHRWMNTLPRHSNTWYLSVLCIIVTLVYKLYSFWLIIIKRNKN